VTASDVLGNRANFPAKLRTGRQGSGICVPQVGEERPLWHAALVVSLVQSCSLIEAQVQRDNYCYEYGGKGEVARID